jgi:urease accessory protein
MVQIDSQASGWQGVARLNYALADGQCIPTQTYTRAPLRVQRALYPEGPALCHTVLVHTAGGLVGGDRLAVQLTVEPQAQVLLTTAAASKVYGNAIDCPAAQTVEINLAPHSCLEWMPQETIVFNHAHYCQDVRVNLAPEAIWVGWDITRFGRSARGETLDQGQWRSHLEVWQNDQPLWLDRQHLVGGSAPMHSLNGLGGYPVAASFMVVGCGISPEHIAALRQLWPGGQAGDMGVTRLQSGVLCRYRGPSTQAARRWFVAAWQYLRPHYLGRAAAASRVWPR